MRRALGFGVVALSASGCSNLLTVDNPNNVSAGALDVPEAAPAIVNGAINTGANAISSMLNAYTVVSDETYWVGSRDDYRLLDTGLLDNNTNEYTQEGFLKAVRARWMAEQAMQKVSKFKTDGRLADVQLLANAYLMGAVMYDAFGNWYDDMPISDRTASGANLGEDKMVQVFDSALKWLDLANAIATGDNRANVLGMRARVKFDRAIWIKLNPPGTTLTTLQDQLVSDAGASADAAAAISAMSGDYNFFLLNDSQNTGDGSSGGVGFEMNSRLEHTPSPDLISVDPTNNKPTAVIAKDPVTGLVDATAVKIMGRFMFADDINHPPLTQTSKRRCF